uniref:RAB26, member RAS oncogene family n=1 Tax=Sinocyclocheilus anshuiensis TaxID=1608454 RepID=A0A671PVU2_9TELE
MSRKKAVKGKGSSNTPSSSPSSDKEKGKKVPTQSNGVVHPSRPSLSNSGEFYDIAFKVMLVGDSGVGKTCLLVRFKDGAFLAGSFISTVGIDFRQVMFVSPLERFRSVTHAYYRDAHALLLLYDVTNKASFDNIQAWLTEIHEFTQQNVVIMLLGNKADSTHERIVKREEGEKLAKDFGVPFMETSAKSGLNVELAFTAVAKELKHREMKEPNEPKFQLQEYVNKEMKGVGCCRS